jgi:hypothetical protein
MGGVKREMERIEDLEGLAAGVALQAGALKECAVHSGELLYQGDPDADSRSYAMATNLWKKGDVDGTREEFMDAIKSAFENASHDGCMRCDKLMRED